VSDLPDWPRWFDAHANALLLWARNWCGCRADAEDAVQLALVKLWQRRPRVDDPAAYAYAAVRSTALDVARSRRRAARRDAEASVADAAAPRFVAPVELEEFRVAVEAALVQLPAEQREVVLLKVWGELTFRQIAATLQIPQNTAASRYRYALEALRRLVGEEVLR
jgi:RNA polymerase sigma-70 factor (ECF subfamily)